MGETTNIAWTDASWSPWHGCTKISPACTNCYAHTFSRRRGHEKRLPTIWGPKAERHFMKEEHWKLPRRWNRKAQRDGVPTKVFCASMADVFEIHGDAAINERMNAARARLWALIEETPHLIWQLLTKRPENISALAPSRWTAAWPSNVWLGVTVENQEYADARIPLLLLQNAAVKFVSYEPALGPVDFTRIDVDEHLVIDALAGVYGEGGFPDRHRLDQIIIGGESGGTRRPFDLAWLRSVKSQCDAAGVALFVKQDEGLLPGRQGRIPDDLWIQQFPTDDEEEPATATVSMVALHVEGDADTITSAVNLASDLIGGGA